MSTTMKAPRASHGFTLLELMVAVVIVGILAAIAYPAYRENLARSRRTQAQVALTGLAAALERYAAQHGSYSGAVGGATLPAPASFYPAAVPDSGSAFYSLAIAQLTATSYAIQATPQGGQTGDRCGTLTLNSVGQADISGAHTGTTVAYCWRR